MALQSARESERVSALREELEGQLEVAQKEHQERVERIVDASEDKITTIN